MSYLTFLRAIHKICVESEVDSNYTLVLNELQALFDFFHENFNLNMSLKTNVILHQFIEYFQKGGTIKNTNGEFVENIHLTLRKHKRSIITE